MTAGDSTAAPSPGAPRRSSGCLPGAISGIVAALVILGTVGASLRNATTGQIDAAADLTCMCGAPLILLAAASGLTWRIGRRAGCFGSGAALALTLAYALFMVVAAGLRSPPRFITDADRAAPLITTAGDREVRTWDRLGIELTLPAGFETVSSTPMLDRLVAAQAAIGPQAMGWQWRRGSEDVALLVIVDRPGMSVQSIAQTGANEARTDYLDRQAHFISQSAPSEAPAVIQLRGPNVVEQVRVVAFRRPDATWRVLLIAASADDVRSAALTDGLHVAP